MDKSCDTGIHKRCPDGQLTCKKVFNFFIHQENAQCKTVPPTGMADEKDELSLRERGAAALLHCY